MEYIKSTWGGLPAYVKAYLGAAAVHGLWNDFVFSCHIVVSYIEQTTTEGQMIKIDPYGISHSSSFGAFWGTLIIHFPDFFFRGLLWPCDLITFVPFALLRRRRGKVQTG